MRVQRAFEAGLGICLLVGGVYCPWAGAQVTPVTLQWFESSWQTMENRTADAFAAGYGRVWTPPISKGENGTASIGYNLFDRFDLGSPGSPTRYGTKAAFEAIIAEQDKASIATFVDLVLNHNATSDNSTAGFNEAGGYPGFVLSYGDDSAGDFHSRFDDCDADPIDCRIAGLIDIAQEKNHVMIRHPVVTGDPQNIPAGTIRNKPADTNRQYYPDVSLPANSIGIHPYNNADPMAGDAVAENATGLLMRSVRWMLETIKVDGFRIDAAKHVPVWFLRDFYDRHVWQRGGTTLTGNATTPYSFMEYYDGAWGSHAYYVCKDGQGNCNTADGVSGNRDTLDFPLYFRMHDELNGTGLGTWENIIGASVDGIIDGNPNNGNFGVQFVSAHDDSLPPPGADNLAYAYILLRAGSPVVYFRAGEFGSVSFPRDGRGDALGGAYGNQILDLIDIHNEYARGDYIERRDAGNPGFQDVLVFERWNSCLVGINDRQDGGYDQRTVVTGFTPGQRLRELTGNATDATVDPLYDIFDAVTVGSGGVVTIRVPRNRNPNNVQHNRGYVAYGPANPDGDLLVMPIAATIAPDPISTPNATRRLTPIEVITADTFEVRLETVDADPLDDGEDDLAMLKMDYGIDINGNGHVDSLDPAFVAYGYEDFLTEKITLKSGGIDINGTQKGLYRQTIDATRLADGRHYLSVIAFRSRPVSSPPIFETWRKVLLLDRVPPEIRLAEPAAGTPITTTSYSFAFRCPDRTASAVHVFLDQPAGTDVVAMAQAGQGQTTKTDRNEFRKTISSLTPGNHRLDVVAFEETGRAGVTTFTGVSVQINGFDGLGDLNNDSKVTNVDIFPFVQMVKAGNQFSPKADMNGDGVINESDKPLFIAKLVGSGMIASQAESAMTQSITTQQPLFWLQADGNTSQLGTVTNPSLNLRVGETAPLYLWVNKGGLAYGFDGVGVDIRLLSGNNGQASATFAPDAPPDRWTATTSGATRSDSGGMGVDDANMIDLTNTDTLSQDPIRLGTLTMTGLRGGAIQLYLCIGKHGIADGGTHPALWLGFASGSTQPESLSVGGGAFGLCSNVPEATITVIGSAADFDGDGDVDMDDYGHLQECLTGTGVPQNDPACLNARLDDDSDIDQNDLNRFRDCLTGPQIPVNSDCGL